VVVVVMRGEWPEHDAAGGGCGVGN
jgi:hypothetical protein